jgi:hypothetical protein
MDSYLGRIDPRNSCVVPELAAPHAVSRFDRRKSLLNGRLTYHNRPPLSSRIRLDTNAIIDG